MRCQELMIDTLAKRARELQTSKNPRPKKIEKLRSLISDSKNGLPSVEPLLLPRNANVEVTGIIAEKSTVQIQHVPSPPLLPVLGRQRIPSHIQGW